MLILTSREALQDMLDGQFASVKTTHALEYYKNHCEFLGYTVEETEEFSIYCRHSRKDALRLILLNRGAGVMAQIIYGFPKHLHHDLNALYMYANDLNGMFYFMKAYVRIFDDNPPALFFTSVFEGDYNRQNFAVFLENIYEDMDKWANYLKTADLWRSPDENS
ncbi:hypothetical protein LEP3755_04350 [Leptolyngbya sp. NIES-3755]|nr:hypothetical protein LEP3755_04350 [Leptolyngbya sp. NIES-3755]